VFVRNFGSFGTGDGQFDSVLRGVAVDNAGNVYVADSEATTESKYSTTKARLFASLDR
jgi:hypothetical protein